MDGDGYAATLVATWYSSQPLASDVVIESNVDGKTYCSSYKGIKFNNTLKAGTNSGTFMFYGSVSVGEGDANWSISPSFTLVTKQDEKYIYELSATDTVSGLPCCKACPHDPLNNGCANALNKCSE